MYNAFINYDYDIDNENFMAAYNAFIEADKNLRNIIEKEFGFKVYT